MLSLAAIPQGGMRNLLLTFRPTVQKHFINGISGTIEICTLGFTVTIYVTANIQFIKCWYHER